MVIAYRIILSKSVSHRENDVDKGFLVFRVDSENIEADAFGGGGLIQER